jgi:hypothetical protein
MNERPSPQRRTVRRGFIGMLESSKAVSAIMNSPADENPQQRATKRLVVLGKHFERLVTVMKSNDSQAATEIVEEHKAARAARNRSATSEDLSRDRY